LKPTIKCNATGYPKVKKETKLNECPFKAIGKPALVDTIVAR